ncbi:hypothetical protein HDU76_008162 [Blyttiomyces sp. JEL0837]|nr:hypothetical protein HDU76_008162 [Blyttiomyces sp. JEL0837]
MLQYVYYPDISVTVACAGNIACVNCGGVAVRLVLLKVLVKLVCGVRSSGAGGNIGGGGGVDASSKFTGLYICYCCLGGVMAGEMWWWWCLCRAGGICIIAGVFCGSAGGICSFGLGVFSGGDGGGNTGVLAENVDDVGATLDTDVAIAITVNGGFLVCKDEQRIIHTAVRQSAILFYLLRISLVAWT